MSLTDMDKPGLKTIKEKMIIKNGEDLRANSPAANLPMKKRLKLLFKPQIHL